MKSFQSAVKLLFTAFCFIPIFSLAQKTVYYDLHVRDTLVNFAGKNKKVLSVNGQIPMPTLEFTQGDLAEITVHNESSQPTALHWHGVHVPNDQDGVPFLTQKPILPGKAHTYRFPIIQNGTHWYHSHSGLQEQDGMYGLFIMHKKPDDPGFRPGIDDLPTIPVILSEWTNLNPMNIQRMLHFGSDWFEIKKGATQSYWEALKTGNLGTKIGNEWKRMAAMDVSDVYYEQFLVNGRDQLDLHQFKPGEKVRLRMANGGASTYFWLQFAGGKITVVANDGNDVEPVEVDRMLIPISETYDIVVTIPEEHGSYELKATSEDRSGSTSIFLGHGKQVRVPILPALNYFKGMKMMNAMMKMNGDMKDMDMPMSFQSMDMNEVMYPELEGQAAHEPHGNASHSHSEMKKEDPESHERHSMPDHGNHAAVNSMANTHHNEHEGHERTEAQAVSHAEKTKPVTLNYTMLKSTKNTAFPQNAPVKEITLELTGNMNRYVWSMDGKALTEVDRIAVKKGEILRMTLRNNSMMRHPMHLHGYDFRILNGQGDYSPMKAVLDIMPMETDVIEFYANNEGDWFFHCHILYHMMAGMSRIFNVGDYQNAELPNRVENYKTLLKNSQMTYFSIENDFASNGNDGGFALGTTRWSLTSEWRLGYDKKHGFESETHLGRYIGTNQWFMPFIGFDARYKRSDHPEKNLFGQKDTKNKRAVFSAGFNYTLPMLIVFQAEAFQDGKVRLQLMRDDIPLSPRLRGEFMVNTDKEYMGGLRYILSRNLSIRAHYDSDMKLGAGLVLTY